MVVQNKRRITCGPSDLKNLKNINVSCRGFGRRLPAKLANISAAPSARCFANRRSLLRNLPFKMLHNFLLANMFG